MLICIYLLIFIKIYKIKLPLGILKLTMSLLEDVKVYRKHALLNYVRKDKVAREYLKNTLPNQLDEDVLERFYRVHQALNSKLIMIKLGKGIVKQSCMFAKSKFEQKLSFLKYITPENIAVDVTDEEYIALIQQINSTKSQGSNLYLIVGKNIIVGLLNINLDHFNSALGGETITEEQLAELTKNISYNDKPVMPNVTIPETPPLVPETSFGQHLTKKRSMDSDTEEEVNYSSPPLKMQKLNDYEYTKQHLNVENEVDVDNKSNYTNDDESDEYNVDIDTEINTEINTKDDTEIDTKINIENNTEINTRINTNTNTTTNGNINTSVDTNVDMIEPVNENTTSIVKSTINTKDHVLQPFDDDSSSSSDDESDVEETNIKLPVVTNKIQNNMIIYNPDINIQSEPVNDSEKLEDLLTKLNSEFDDVAETVNEAIETESPAPMNVESLLRMVKEKKVKKNAVTKETLTKLQFSFE